MKFTFRFWQGINPVFSIATTTGNEHWYLLRLDWILILAAMAGFAIWVGV